LTKYLLSGATSAVVLIHREKTKRTIYSANCGDARTVLVYVFNILILFIIFNFNNKKYINPKDVMGKGCDYQRIINPQILKKKNV
jgi:hypothetical protein